MVVFLARLCPALALKQLGITEMLLIQVRICVISSVSLLNIKVLAKCRSVHARTRSSGLRALQLPLAALALHAGLSAHVAVMRQAFSCMLGVTKNTFTIGPKP